MADRTGAGAPVYMAAILEYLTAEILELAGNSAARHKRVRITPTHLVQAFRNDEELNKMIGRGIIPESQAMPNIHVNLLPKQDECSPTK